MRQRDKIIRRPGGSNYPLYVCKRCGTHGAEDSKTRIEKYVEYQLAHCGVCRELSQVASPRDFGWPTFYTYMNGAPVGG